MYDSWQFSTCISQFFGNLRTTFAWEFIRDPKCRMTCQSHARFQPKKRDFGEMSLHCAKLRVAGIKLPCKAPLHLSRGLILKFSALHVFLYWRKKVEKWTSPWIPTSLMACNFIFSALLFHTDGDEFTIGVNGMGKDRWYQNIPLPNSCCKIFIYPSHSFFGHHVCFLCVHFNYWESKNINVSGCRRSQKQWRKCTR